MTPRAGPTSLLTRAKNRPASARTTYQGHFATACYARNSQQGSKRSCGPRERDAPYWAEGGRSPPRRSAPKPATASSPFRSCAQPGQTWKSDRPGQARCPRTRALPAPAQGCLGDDGCTACSRLVKRAKRWCCESEEVAAERRMACASSVALLSRLPSPAPHSPAAAADVRRGHAGPWPGVPPRERRSDVWSRRRYWAKEMVVDMSSLQVLPVLVWSTTLILTALVDGAAERSS